MITPTAKPSKHKHPLAFQVLNQGALPGNVHRFALGISSCPYNEGKRCRQVGGQRRTCCGGVCVGGKVRLTDLPYSPCFRVLSSALNVTVWSSCRFSSCQIETLTKHSPPSPSPWPPPFNFLSLWIRLFQVLIQVECVILWMAYFTQHNALKLHPCHSVDQNSRPF